MFVYQTQSQTEDENKFYCHGRFLFLNILPILFQCRSSDNRMIDFTPALKYIIIYSKFA